MCIRDSSKGEYKELVNLAKAYKEVIGISCTTESIVRDAVNEFIESRNAWLRTFIEDMN